MARTRVRPIITVRRIPAGERELGDVMADVILWKYDHPLLSGNEGDTLERSDLNGYSLIKNEEDTEHAEDKEDGDLLPTFEG